jgi:hypothetical protein
MPDNGHHTLSRYPEENRERQVILQSYTFLEAPWSNLWLTTPTGISIGGKAPSNAEAEKLLKGLKGLNRCIASCVCTNGGAWKAPLCLARHSRSTMTGSQARKLVQQVAPGSKPRVLLPIHVLP